MDDKRIHGQREKPLVRAVPERRRGYSVRQMQTKPEFRAGYGAGGNHNGLMRFAGSSTGFDQLIIDPDLHGLVAAVCVVIQYQLQRSGHFRKHKEHLRVVRFRPGARPFVAAETGNAIAPRGSPLIEIQGGAQGILPGKAERVFMENDAGFFRGSIPDGAADFIFYQIRNGVFLLK